MRQLSGADAFFLFSDKPGQHQHVSSLYIYDPSKVPGGKVSFDAILDHVRDRLSSSRIFRQRLVEVPLRSGQIDLKAMLEMLAKEGLTRIFCEGGGSFAAGLLSEGLVDEVMLFTAGKVIGAEGRPSVGPLGLDALKDAPAFELEETRPVGADVVQIWHRGI